MLLRRVALHVRDQNWTAVLIDFAIVVVGVFVGLQVQDWNEFRKYRVEEQQLLGRLLEEAVQLIDAHDQELRQFRFRADVLIGVNIAERRDHLIELKQLLTGAIQGSLRPE